MKSRDHGQETSESDGGSEAPGDDGERFAENRAIDLFKLLARKARKQESQESV